VPVAALETSNAWANWPCRALRPVQGVLPAALAAREAGRALVVPREAEEASLASGLVVYAVGHLLELVAHLSAGAAYPMRPTACCCSNALTLTSAKYRARLAAKRALLLAAAGAHNLLFTGPPGTGKTLLASRLPGLLPPLDEREALEVAAIQLGQRHAPLDSWPQRPFRHPITPPRARRWSVAAAAAGRNHPWRTMACCFSMSCQSSSGACWKCCASH
jgi:magnesium chelatase family protein